MKFCIREHRERAKLTQEELAEKSGVSRATISNLEMNSTDTCTTKTLSKIANVLNVDVSALFFEEKV